MSEEFKRTHCLVSFPYCSPCRRTNKNIISPSCFFVLIWHSRSRSGQGIFMQLEEQCQRHAAHRLFHKLFLFGSSVWNSSSFPLWKKEEKKNRGEPQTPSAAWCWVKHYVRLLRLCPVTIGRANSTKSSMRTGHAPEEREEQSALALVSDMVLLLPPNSTSCLLEPDGVAFRSPDRAKLQEFCSFSVKIYFDSLFFLYITDTWSSLLFTFRSSQ